MTHRFLVSESGAVTVDWTVMTGVLVGLGLAVSAAVSTGTQDAAEDVDATLRGDLIKSSFDLVPTIVDTSFADGLGPWVGGALRTVAGLGQVLQLDGEDSSASATYELDPEARYAVIEMDVHYLDSWDWERGWITVNGQQVLMTQNARGGLVNSSTQTPDGYETTLEVGEVEHVGGSRWVDRSDRVRIVVENPGGSLDLGMSTTLDQAYSDESMVLSGVRVTSTDTP